MFYTYDSSNVTYGIGRLTKVSNGLSTTSILAYDPLGQVLAGQQSTNGQTYNFAYTWDLAGALTSERYPSGRFVQTTYDQAGRPASVSGTLNQALKTYVSGVNYAPQGTPNWLSYGNGLCRSFTYNRHYNYDRYGNMWTDLNQAAGVPVSAQSPTSQGTFVDANNHMTPSLVNYDGVGNQINAINSPQAAAYDRG